MTNEKTTELELEFTDEEYAQIKEASDLRGITVEEFIIAALTEMVKSE